MTKDGLVELGKRVRMIRKELHISQKDFARKIKISGSFLSEIEAGKSKPGYDFFYKMCTVHDFMTLLWDGQYGKYYRMMDSEKGYVFEKSVENAKEIDWGKKKKSHKVMHRALVI